MVGLAGIGEGHALAHFKGHFRAAMPSASIIVLLDGKEVHRSPVLATQGEPWPLVVSIPPKTRRLRIVVHDNADGHEYDFVDVAGLGLVRAGRALGAARGYPAGCG